ncbi:MAG: hypothetical protein ACREKH_07995, partial [Candidatus Rokuibacteriota bacterium]
MEPRPRVRSRRRDAVLFAALLALALLAPTTAPAALPADAKVEALVAARDFEAIQALGGEVMPVLVRLYQAGDADRRTDIAKVFYRLGWKSEEAAKAMLADAHTDHQRLRLAVQWALGRVSSDDVVVDTLLDTLVNDPEPLFRDKAGCGLASDQIHLTEAQKLRLYERLVELLESPNPETRSLAIQILHVHTGQYKGYH